MYERTICWSSKCFLSWNIRRPMQHKKAPCALAHRTIRTVSFIVAMADRLLKKWLTTSVTLHFCTPWSHDFVANPSDAMIQWHGGLVLRKPSHFHCFSQFEHHDVRQWRHWKSSVDVGIMQNSHWSLQAESFFFRLLTLVWHSDCDNLVWCLVLCSSFCLLFSASLLSCSLQRPWFHV